MNPDPHPRKLLRTETRRHGFNSVVRARRPFRPDPDVAPWQIQIVINQNQVLRQDLMFSNERLNRGSTQVHKGLWLGQQHRLSGNSPRSGQRHAFRPRDPYIVPGGEYIRHQEAQVVRSVRVLLTRVPQASDKPHSGK